MNSLKTYLLAVLALATLGTAYFAWQQSVELVELRAAALDKDERASLQKRLWDLEKRNKQLTDRLAAPSNSPEREPSLPGASDDRATGEGRSGRGPGNAMQIATAMRDLMAKPEVQALLNVQQRARADAQYAALFRNLNLTSNQVEKLKIVLADRQTTLQDAASAAREQGIDPRRDPASYQKLMASVQSDLNASIKSVLGDSGFTQFESYEKTLPQRNVVNQLQQRLSYTDNPLSSAQAEQLVQILATNTPAPTRSAPPATAPAGPPPFGGPRGPDLGAFEAVIGNLTGGGPGGGILALAGDGGRGLASATVTPAAVSQSQSVLSTPQVAALQQIQQQQQSQQQLAKIISDTMSAQGGGRSPPPLPVSATPRPGG